MLPQPQLTIQLHILQLLSYVLHMFLYCKYRLEDAYWEEKGVEFFSEKSFLMFAWTKRFSKHQEREIASPLRITEVSICLSNPSFCSVKPQCLSIEMNGKWQVCILGCTTLMPTCCYRSTDMAASPVVNPALLFKGVNYLISKILELLPYSPLKHQTLMIRAWSLSIL